jgi:hypothetical protein
VFIGCAYLFRGNGLLRRLVQLLNSLLVVSQILLAADEDDGKAGAEVQNLGDPLERESLVSKCLQAAVLHMMPQHREHVSGWFTFSWTLSNESGESTAKQMRMTCESG